MLLLRFYPAKPRRMSRGSNSTARPQGKAQHRASRQLPYQHLPKALLPDGEGGRLQGEDLGLDEELTHPAVDDLPVLCTSIQDDDSSLVVVLPVLQLSSSVLWL